MDPSDPAVRAGGDKNVTGEKPEFVLTSTMEYPEYSSSAPASTLAMVTLVGACHEVVHEARASRAPIDLVAVVDRSGSMAGEKLSLVMETMKFIAQQLKPTDRFSIVSYDTNVTVDLPLQHMNSDAKLAAERKITQLRAGSSTNLSGGLLSGLQQVMNREGKNQVASVLVFTDGLANHGLTSAGQIVTAMTGLMAKIPSACTVFTFGFGKDHSEHMLKAIADAGKGLYYYIENADSIPQAFADCVGGLLSVVAQNITLTLEAKNNVVVDTVLSKYPMTADPEHRKHTVTIGDLYSEESRNTICKITIPALSEPADTFEVLVATVSFFNVITSSFVTMSTSVSVRRPSTVRASPSRDFLLDRQNNRLTAAEAMENARKVADAGQLDKAKAVIMDAIALISSSISRNDELCVGMIRDLKESLTDMETASDYRNRGAKKMAWKSQEHERERCVSNTSGYENAAKKDLKLAYAEKMRQERAKRDQLSAASLPTPAAPAISPRPGSPNPPPAVYDSLRSTRPSMPALGRTILIGNDYLGLAAPAPAPAPVPAAAPAEPAPPADKSEPPAAASPDTATPTQPTPAHRWTVYVRGADLEQVLDKVEFLLQPSFCPSAVTAFQAPFEITRTSDAEFVVRVRLHFKAEHNCPPMESEHMLSFQPQGASASLDL